MALPPHPLQAQNAKSILWIVLLILCGVLIFPSPSAAQISGTEPILLEAERLEADQDNEIITASGNVELVQGQNIIRADRITYDKKNDTVTARGNISYLDPQGNVYFSDNLEFTQRFKRGFVEGLRVLLKDGSKLTAAQGRRLSEDKLVLYNARFTPCDTCADESPFWHLEAGRVLKDDAKQDVTYKDVTLRIKDVPVAYTPYFAHPSPEVKQRNGFLTPAAGFNTKLGTFARGQYYYGLSPSEDITFEGMVMSDQPPLVGATWRKRFERGEIDVQGSITRSEILTGGDDNEVLKAEDWRGFIAAEGKYDINENWRTGLNVKRSTDDFFLKDYDYDDRNILRNRIYAENFFGGRNYGQISGWYFQDLRPGDREKQPDIFPWAEYRLQGAPNAAFGGRLAADVETVGLLRSDRQSVNRISFAPNWQRRLIAGGVVSDVTAKLRADGWWVRDRFTDDLTADNKADETVARVLPQIHMKSAYPLVKPTTQGHFLIEPKAALTVAPDFSVDESIPNEDGQDIQIDVSNLFTPNRFPGVDRYEGGTHLAYGLRTGYIGNDGRSLTASVGRSRRFTENQALYPLGSGLENQNSDIVGQVEANWSGIGTLSYRTQLDSDSKAARRHELESTIDIPETGTRIQNNYLFAKSIEGTDITERDQLRTQFWQDLNENWSLLGSTVYNLDSDSENSGLLRAMVGVDYQNECFLIGARVNKDLTDRLSGGSETSVVFRIGLKPFGVFSTPALSGSTVSGDDDEEILD